MEGADKKDLGDMFYVFSVIYKDLDENKYYSKGSDELLVFDLSNVLIWVKAKNKEIAEIIQERLQGLRD